MASRERRLRRARSVVMGILLLSLGLLPLASGDAAPSVDSALMSSPRDATTSLRDRDGDRIDDVIMAIATGRSVGTFPDGFKHVRFDVTAEGLVFDVLVRFQGGVDARDAERLSFVAGGREVRLFPLAESVWVRGVPVGLVDDLLAVPGADYVAADRTVVPATREDAQTHMVRASERYGRGVWERFRTAGRGVTIAVLDSGIDDEHRTFGAGRNVGAYDATHWFLRDNDTNRDDPDSQDTYTHGTYVAGVAFGGGVPTITEEEFFSRAPLRMERLGIAPYARYLDVKVLATDPEGNAFGLGSEDLVAGTSSMVLEGLEFVRRYNMGESHLGNVTPREVEVVLMSLGESEADPAGNSTLAFAVDNLTALTGVVVVAAAGNCGPGAARSETVWDVLYKRCSTTGANAIPAPGSAKSAITVAAMDMKDTLEWDDDEIALFSSSGPGGGEDKPNVAASGVLVEGPLGRPTKRDELWRWEPATDAYQNMSGTSAAAAVVAGIVALVKEADPHLTPERVKEILMVTARDIEQKGWDATSGAGAVDAFDAVAVALGYLDESLFNGTKEDGPKEELPTVPRPPVIPPVVVNRVPRVAFKATPQPAVTGERIRFTDLSWDPEGDPIVERSWDFGDGATAKGPNVTHVYTRPGVYLVRLSVTDSNGTSSGSNVGRQDVIVQGPVLSEDAPAVGALWLVLLVAVFFALRARDPALKEHQARPCRDRPPRKPVHRKV